MLKPLHNRLMVERLEAEQTTSSGLIIPDSAKEKPQQGRVISVGPGARDKEGKRVPMRVNVGDTVLFTKYGGTDVSLDGYEYLILKEDDVLGVISGAGKSGAGKGAAGKSGAAKSSTAKGSAAKGGKRK